VRYVLLPPIERFYLFVKISTPSSAIAMCGAAGVNNSSPVLISYSSAIIDCKRTRFGCEYSVQCLNHSVTKRNMLLLGKLSDMLW